MRLFKFLIFFLALVVLAFSFFAKVSADESEPTLKVDHIATTGQKIKEKLSLLFKFKKQAKADYYLYLSEKRLAELVYAVESNQLDLVEPTASRYTTYVGIMTDFILARNVFSHKEKTVLTLARHEEILRILQSKFEFESGWWIAITHGVNSAKLFREKLTSL